MELRQYHTDDDTTATGEIPAELLARGRELVAELGRVPGRPTLVDRLDISTHQARLLAAELRQSTA